MKPHSILIQIIKDHCTNSKKQVHSDWEMVNVLREKNVSEQEIHTIMWEWKYVWQDHPYTDELHNSFYGKNWVKNRRQNN